MSNLNPSAEAKSVTATKSLVVNDDSTPTGRNEDGRITYEIYNLGPNTIFLGSSNVTAANGQPLPINAARTFSVRFNAKIWAVCDTGDTADVRVLKVP